MRSKSKSHCTVHVKLVLNEHTNNGNNAINNNFWSQLLSIKEKLGRGWRVKLGKISKLE